METRVLGRTGIPVTVIGFGAWAIGSQWGPQEDEESVRALHRAIDLGCRFIDTAQAYGEGRSEGLVARVLAERAEEVVVATKVPPKNRVWDPPAGTPIREAFPKEYIIERCEVSLRNLRRDVLDVYQLHTWIDDWNDDDEWFEAMSRLKEQGKIRAIGISVPDGRPDAANRSIAKGRVDTIQVVYNILDQQARQVLFPLARQHGVGIIARVPLASGALTGRFRRDTTFPEGDWRRDFFRGELLERVVRDVARVQEIVGTDQPLVVRALQFCVADPTVSTVIPGIRSAAQAESNLAAASAPPLSPAALEALYALDVTPPPASPSDWRYLQR